MSINVTYANEFLITDPAPEEYQKIEVDVLEASLRSHQYTSLNLPSMQISYGIVPDLDLELILNYSFYTPNNIGSSSANGIGDTTITSTYCFMHESKYLPQISFVPTYLIPTGDYNAGLGNGKPTLALPIFAQKTWGAWEIVTNIGYMHNTAPLTLNYFYGGIRLVYGINKDVNLGIELYRQGATSNTITVAPLINNAAKTSYVLALGKYTVLNVGGDYAITKHMTLQASAGTNIDGADVFVTYLGFNYFT